jgi:hypothetical protein
MKAVIEIIDHADPVLVELCTNIVFQAMLLRFGPYLRNNCGVELREL